MTDDWAKQKIALLNKGSLALLNSKAEPNAQNLKIFGDTFVKNLSEEISAARGCRSRAPKV